MNDFVPDPTKPQYGEWLFGHKNNNTQAWMQKGMSPPPGPPSLTRNYLALFVGDSTTVGVGAGPAGGVNGSFEFSVPPKTAEALIALGVNATRTAVGGDGNNGFQAIDFEAYRADINVTGSLTSSSRSPTAGGNLWRASGAAPTNSLIWSPVDPCDTVDIWFPTASAFGTLAVRLAGDLQPDFTWNQSTPTNDFQKATISGIPLELHTFQFYTLAGSSHGPCHMVAYNSAEFSVQCLGVGARNWSSTNWQGAAFPSSPLPSIGIFNPDILIIDLGINDWRAAGAGTSIAVFKANMQAIIDQAPDAFLILVVPNPLNQYTAPWTPEVILQTYQELAADNPGSVVVNAPEVYFLAGLSGAVNPASWTALNAAGNMDDNFHPRAPVYAAEADAIAKVIATHLGFPV